MILFEKYGQHRPLSDSLPSGIGPMRRNLFWLSDDQWRRIEPLLPSDVRGKERVDDRRVISGILHVLKSGCRWCDCPPEYGPPTTIYNRFVRWAERGVWEKLFRILRPAVDQPRRR
jgi:transposase